MLIGEDAAQIAASLGEELPVSLANDMTDAVHKARAQAHAGDVVLLSPACASFDMYDNFEHRGRVFSQAVGALQ